MVRGKDHILAIPFPAQGHAIPLMELSQKLAKEGFRITFVNTDFNHKRVVSSFSSRKNKSDIHLVSIPDGLGDDGDRNHLELLVNALSLVIPVKLKELIENINSSVDDGKITCIIADMGMRWAFDLAQEMGIQAAGFWSASTSLYASTSNIQNLIDDGVIDKDGTPMDQKLNRFSTLTPAMDSKNFCWIHMGNSITQRFFMEVTHQCNPYAENLEWVLCNSAYDLEPGAFTLAPNIKPIGPLLINYQPEKSAVNFWLEDATCLEWLDQQPPRSVIYAAFGSFTILQQNQFQELALGLELSNRPFLWVVRPDMTHDDDVHESLPSGFLERTAGRARLVGWAPQQKVLGHDSVACFLSHCGWNSTLEGLSNGLPFLCWPYFADQFTNESYICDVWKIGLRLEKDETRIISKDEIKRKLDQLLGNHQVYRGRACELKEVAHKSVKEGGLSDQNFRAFTKWLKH